MKPAESTQGQEQGDLYRSRLSWLLDQSHPLYVLAEAIDWEFFEREFGALYEERKGRPGLPMRLLVGLHYLKHLYDVSDERVVAGFVENPYWQYFCGEEFFVHEMPCDPTSLVKWRQRIGPGGMEKLLAETIAAAQREQALKPAEIRRVNVDTTVQEKAIAFPTDARLYHKARCVLVREAQRAGLELRQSYKRVGQTGVTKARALCARAATEASAERDAEVAHLPGPSDARHSTQSRGERHGTGPAIVAVLGASGAHLSTAAGRQAQALQHAGAGS